MPRVRAPEVAPGTDCDGDGEQHGSGKQARGAGPHLGDSGLGLDNLVHGGGDAGRGVSGARVVGMSGE